TVWRWAPHPRQRGTCDGALLDHLGRPQQDRLGDGEAKRLRRLHIDDQIKCRRLLDGEIPRPGTLQYLVHIGGGAPVEVTQVGSVGNKTARFRVLSPEKDG